MWRTFKYLLPRQKNTVNGFKLLFYSYSNSHRKLNLLCETKCTPYWNASVKWFQWDLCGTLGYIVSFRYQFNWNACHLCQVCECVCVCVSRFFHFIGWSHALFILKTHALHDLSRLCFLFLYFISHMIHNKNVLSTYDISWDIFFSWFYSCVTHNYNSRELFFYLSSWQCKLTGIWETKSLSLVKRNKVERIHNKRKSLKAIW